MYGNDDEHTGEIRAEELGQFFCDRCQLPVEHEDVCRWSLVDKRDLPPNHPLLNARGLPGSDNEVISVIHARCLTVQEQRELGEAGDKR